MLPICEGPIEVSRFVQNMLSNPQIKRSKDSGYDYFLKIIEKSGEETSGRLIKFNSESMIIDIFAYNYEFESRTISRTFVLVSKISSIFSLNNKSYPPKIAHDFLISEPEDRASMMVKATLFDSKNFLIGRLDDVQPQQNIGIIIPIIFSIELIPRDQSSVMAVSLEKIISMTLLPDTPKSILRQGQANLFQSLRLPSVLIDLVIDYLEENALKQLPEISYAALLEKIEKRNNEFNPPSKIQKWISKKFNNFFKRIK